MLSIDRKKTLPPARGHVTRYSFTSSFMTRGTVNWSQTKLVFSLQCCKLTSHALLALLAGVEDIVWQNFKVNLNVAFWFTGIFVTEMVHNG